MTSPRPKYQPGPDDVAALSLGDDVDTDTRRQAVEACLGALQRNEGLGTLSTANLRATAWEVDGGETAATPSAAWESYVRPSLNALDTVSSPSPGRYRYCGPSERVEDPARLASPNTSQAVGVSPENDPLLAALAAEGTDARAALSAGERNELEKCEMVANMMNLSVRDVRRRRLRNDEADAPAASSSDEGTDHDRNADAASAAGTIDRGPTPTPNEPADVDPTNPEDRARMAGAQAQLEHNARKRAAGGDGNAALAASGDGDVDHGQDGREKCARCGENPAEIAAPGVHNAQYSAGDRLCPSCFRRIASGEQ